MREGRRLLAVFAITLLAACGGGGSDYSTTPPPPSNTGNNNPPPSGGTANAITVNDNYYDPATRTVSVGATVTWQWTGGYSTHSVTFGDGVASPTQSSGTFSRTFTIAGTYRYTCAVHGSTMSGTITVQ